MQIFLKARENFKVVGIKSNQKYSFNGRNILSLLLYGQFVISTMTFFLTEARTLKEYVNSFYAFMASIGVIFGILICTWKMKNIFELIMNMENCIDESEHITTSRVYLHNLHVYFEIIINTISLLLWLQDPKIPLPKEFT